MGKAYWIQQMKIAGIKAIKASAHTAVAIISASAMMSDVNWLEVVSASGLAGIISLLSSIANLPDYDSKDTCITTKKKLSVSSDEDNHYSSSK